MGSHILLSAVVIVSQTISFLLLKTYPEGDQPVLYYTGGSLAVFLSFIPVKLNLSAPLVYIANIPRFLWGESQEILHLFRLRSETK